MPRFGTFYPADWEARPARKARGSRGDPAETMLDLQALLTKAESEVQLLSPGSTPEGKAAMAALRKLRPAVVEATSAVRRLIEAEG